MKCIQEEMEMVLLKNYDSLLKNDGFKTAKIRVVDTSLIYVMSSII